MAKKKWKVRRGVWGVEVEFGKFSVDIEDYTTYKDETAYLEAAAELLPRIKAAWKSKKEGEF
jgi:hypothetical protein